MITLKTVLPNFVKTAVFIAATTIGFSAFAAHHEEAVDAVTDATTGMTDTAEGAMADVPSDASVEGAEVIGDLKDMTEEGESMHKALEIEAE